MLSWCLWNNWIQAFLPSFLFSRHCHAVSSMSSCHFAPSNLINHCWLFKGCQFRISATVVKAELQRGPEFSKPSPQASNTCTMTSYRQPCGPLLTADPQHPADGGPAVTQEMPSQHPVIQEPCPWNQQNHLCRGGCATPAYLLVLRFT